MGAGPRLWVSTGSEDKRLSTPWNPHNTVRERPALAILFLPFHPSCLSDAQGFDTAMLMGFPGDQLPCLSQREDDECQGGRPLGSWRGQVWVVWIEDSRSAQCLRASWKWERTEEERGLETEGRGKSYAFHKQ